MKSFSLPTVFSLQNDNKESKSCLAALFFITTIFFGGLQTALAQTITDIFPTRVTEGSEVTVIGSGFTNATRDAFSVGSLQISSRRRNGTTEMTFVISGRYTTTGNPIIINNELGQIISFGSGVTFDSGVATTLDYIAPVDDQLTTAKSFFVKEIYTNWDHDDDGIGFWRSDWNDRPDDYHELLGFKMQDNTIYSTGVDNDVLLQGLGYDPNNPPSAPIYVESTFKAYSTNGVQGNVNRSAQFLLTGNQIDGVQNNSENTSESQTQNNPNIAGVTIYESIIDGKNGLELGTGISNFNRDTEVRFFSGNGQFGAVGNGEPDLLITQIAQAGGKDVYYYADNLGNVVGHPIRIEISDSVSTVLSNWELDLFEYQSGAIATSVPRRRRRFRSDYNDTRPIRMLAFELSDFGINATAGSTGDIN
jgi:hypothetical protein